VLLLLTNGADVNAKSKGGYTPLDFAAHEGYEDVAELLRRHGGHE
jgi:ankyrin repeat protein